MCCEEKRKSYYWLLRIINKSDVKFYSKGQIKFGKPLNWIKQGDGRNDIFEGALAIELANEKRKYTNCKNHPRTLQEEIIGKYRIIRDVRTLNVPTLCFYGLEEKNGRIDVPDKYFTDFCDCREDYCIIVIEAKSFYNELQKSLNKIGFNNELFFHSIIYENKNTGYNVYPQFPYELLRKDEDRYSHQNEARMLVVSENKDLIDIFDRNDYIVNIDINNIIHGFLEVPTDNEKVIITINNNELFIDLK